ncbi:flavin-containing monooxygenase FMO GS-OX-like 2 [Lytechinus variegatus]|uniref:flavin-containing monooxygenase FMO GS-OX-like 2 n=1 Tax=Lytechinus variegatus TaxID=7654 RepID=UPI001BB12610|nr:flavin-containing monooxygenase FMO GS-OX-like 2 [Lytechinus variegatus]XP_041458804.1 flavin-containing monooxygenase FMO GS-OX-like 2 [Lytechinus variegatus]XP_041458805.1 flavin-containing monooxygenase FMO GS-OX-like 2 [Lytechinus variegatus]XP_041458806.1 flavin-containing monooxygenase FMO GS-OX-like 2 [Lytechinus variegatus]
MMNKLRVAVIGGGGAGLCAARYMGARPDRFEPVVFEKADCVGGTWVYTEETGKDRHGLPIHSSMYSSLKTNLPKEVMAFPDFPFDSSLPSFVKHTDMLRYLEQYASHFDLLKYIQFNTLVESVRPVKPSGDTKSITWEVRVRNLENQESGSTTSHYDAVMVCNGHYAQPKIPQMDGLDTFSGQILHSHNYRHPESYKDQSVLIIGAGASGIDIALDLSPHARQVYLSHWKPRLKTPIPSNIKEVQAVKSICKTEVEFLDGHKDSFDCILFCSGYYYDFSFLHPDCSVDVTDGRITPLYKHVIHQIFPSLCFIGIAIRICPFPHFSAQTQFFLAALDGSMKLPTQKEMQEDEARDYQKKLDEGLPHRYAHLMGERQWGYHSDILSLAGAKQHQPVVEKLYKHVSVYRGTDVSNYKKMNFDIMDNENFVQLQSLEQ